MAERSERYFMLISNRLYPSNSSAAGFTLIEIMVVLLLMALAGSLVLMNVGQSGRMKQNRIFAENLVVMCKTARLTAMSDGFPACLVILPEVRKCLVTGMENIAMMETEPEMADGLLGGSGAKTPGYRSVSIPDVVLIEGEQIKSNGAGAHFVCFYSDGSSSGCILSVSVEDDFLFSFQVDMLTGTIHFLETSNL